MSYVFFKMLDAGNSRVAIHGWNKLQKILSRQSQQTYPLAMSARCLARSLPYYGSGLYTSFFPLLTVSGYVRFHFLT